MRLRCEIREAPDPDISTLFSSAENISSENIDVLRSVEGEAFQLAGKSGRRRSIIHSVDDALVSRLSLDRFFSRSNCFTVGDSIKAEVALIMNQMHAVKVGGNIKSLRRRQIESRIVRISNCLVQSPPPKK